MSRVMHDTLYILRHGQTEWNLSGRMQGSADSPLTAAGRVQAIRQGRILGRYAPVEACAIYCSPRGRTRETASFVVPDQLHRVVMDERLAEIDMGDWTGHLRSDLAVAWPDSFGKSDRFDYYRNIPNGESIESVATRVEDFLADMDSPAIIVTHGITSRILRCRVRGLPAQWFNRQPGGQGIVYRLHEGRQERLITP